MKKPIAVKDKPQFNDPKMSKNLKKVLLSHDGDGVGS